MEDFEELLAAIHVEPRNPCRLVIALAFDLVSKAALPAIKVLNGLNFILAFIFVASSYDRSRRLDPWLDDYLVVLETVW